jgi:hypothetical protein
MGMLRQLTSTSRVKSQTSGRLTLDKRSLATTIDFATHDFSLLLVDPKPKMVEWVENFKKEKGWEQDRLYYPEGNLAVIVPKIDRFSMPGQFQQFVERMKPRLLEAELHRFNANPADFGHSIT